jgi:hypothetical protein
MLYVMPNKALDHLLQNSTCLQKIQGIPLFRCEDLLLINDHFASDSFPFSTFKEMELLIDPILSALVPSTFGYNIYRYIVAEDHVLTFF